jgi:subtilisin family serine protease
MRRRLLAAVMVATMATAFGPVGTIAAGPDGAGNSTDAGGPAPTKAIVTFRAPPGRAAEALIRQAGGEVRFRYTIIPAMAVTVPAQAIDGLRHNPLVEAIELDGTVTILDHGTPTGDLEYDNAWGVHHIGAKRVHDSGVWGQGVKVAVIDSGIDYVHFDLSGPQPVYPEFNGNYQGGWDFVNNDSDPMDDNGHGTHVSGILAADRNGYLVAGVAPQVDLYALKVVDASGNGEYSSVIAALQWAVNNGIDVVNMSVGGHDPSDALADAVEAVYQAGVLMVAAAGNVNPLSLTELIYGCPVVVPAAYPHVLATTFTQGTNELTGYSCTGLEVDFAAPGDQVYAPVPVGSCTLCSVYGYQPLSGTSMASPHLAGLVALVLSHGINDANGDTLLFDEVRTHLCANTDPGGRIAQSDPRYPKWYGCGVIDAGEALVDNPPPTGPPNSPPVATADSATTGEDVATTIAVLANDSDPNGDPLSVASSTQPAHGTAAINAGTTVTYTPAANWNGTDTFGYTVSDGRGGSASATVSVTVTPVNDPPVAANQAVTTAEDTARAVTLGATDPEGNPLTYATIAPPAHGTLSGTAPNVTYTPATNYAGSDSFTFKANDGTADSAPATVSITVSAANDAPVCATVSLTTPEDVTGSSAPSCTDVDGGPPTYSIVGTAAHGSASVVAGQLSYAPVANYNGPDTFTYRAYDGSLDSNAATVNVTVTPVNDPPVAANDAASTNQGVPVTIAVLGNDSDIDGGALSVTGVTPPTNGTTVVNAATTVTYTPTAGYTGSDSFGYTIADAMGGTASATVSVSVGVVPTVFMHIGDLVPNATRASRSWTAQVGVLVVDQDGAAVAGATVSGKWTGGAKGSGSCITLTNGLCTIAKSSISLSKTSITFTVTSVTKTGATYNAGANLETSITIAKP